jgi:hypothetical protein
MGLEAMVVSLITAPWGTQKATYLRPRFVPGGHSPNQWVCVWGGVKTEGGKEYLRVGTPNFNIADMGQRPTENCRNRLVGIDAEALSPGLQAYFCGSTRTDISLRPRGSTTNMEMPSPLGSTSPILRRNRYGQPVKTVQ